MPGRRSPVVLLLTALLLAQPPLPHGRRSAKPRAGAAPSTWNTPHEAMAMRSAAGAPADADAAALLELAADASLRHRFATATQLLQLAAAAVPAPPASAADLSLLVEAGEGLLGCGEVQLAAKLLRYAQASAPAKRNVTPEYAGALSAAGAALARAVASDSSTQPEERIALIETASKAAPRPDLQWHLWATNVLKFQVQFFLHFLLKCTKIELKCTKIELT